MNIEPKNKTKTALMNLKSKYFNKDNYFITSHQSMNLITKKMTKLRKLCCLAFFFFIIFFFLLLYDLY